MIEQEITLTEILTAREERVAIQNALLSEYAVPVVSFTMNMAGPVKVTALSHRAFLWGMEQLRLGLLQNRMSVRKEFSRALPTGDEGYFAVDAQAEAVKALCVEIEETFGVGRLFDMDVIGLDGHKLERGSERPCIVCGKPGRECASRRLHSVAELQFHTASLLAAGLRSAAQDLNERLATNALLEEVAVTPKPGLVDRANNGAHSDMDFSSFQVSAAALAAYWRGCFGIGCFDRAIVPNTLGRPVPPSETFAKLRPLGRQAERDMLAATGGVNTHKGAIFTLGVLCGAIGRLWTAETGFPDADAILNEAAAMTRETLEKELPAARWNTAGEALYQKYGVRGIRGQVADGLPAVREIGLPVFQKLLAEGLDRNHAAAVTLLHLIANVEDTNLLHRGGPEGAAWAREAAGTLLTSPACRGGGPASRPVEGFRPSEAATLPICHSEQSEESVSPAALRAAALPEAATGDAGPSTPLRSAQNDKTADFAAIPSLEEIAELDRQFIERNLSPGGCADLLAVTLFLESLSNLD